MSTPNDYEGQLEVYSIVSAKAAQLHPKLQKRLYEELKIARKERRKAKLREARLYPLMDIADNILSKSNKPDETFLKYIPVSPPASPELVKVKTEDNLPDLI